MYKNSYELAQAIVNNLGDVRKSIYGIGWQVDMMGIIGMSFGSIEKSKHAAIKDIAKQLAGEIDSGALHLSDTWAEDNLGA